jgi:hypothetical protein
MAENKKSFIAYADWKETFENLPDEMAGKLIKHIFSYVNDENPKTEDYVINAVFANIKHTLKRDLDKWESQLEQRRLAGKKSAEIRATKSNDRSNSLDETTRNSTDNVSVSVSVSDSVSDIKPKRNKFNFKKSLIDYGFKESLVEDWLVVRKAKKASNTETSFDSFISMVEKEKCEINSILEYIVEKSWSGFNWEWVKNNNDMKLFNDDLKNKEIIPSNVIEVNGVKRMKTPF